jgi:hypothetical protein
MAIKKTTAANGKTPNPTVTALFPDERWGTDPDGNPNFISADIDAKAFDVLAKIQIGDKLKLKRTMSKSGKEMAYLEVIANDPNFKKKATKNANSETTGF